MSRTTKILLVIGGLVALACCGSLAAAGYFGMQVSRNIDLSPDAANSTAAEIADYTLPEGYSAQMGIAMFGMKMALFAKGDIKSNPSQGMMLALIELPGDGDASGAAGDAIKDSASQQMGGQIKDGQQIESTDIQLRGETVTLTVTEGTGNGGNTVRQATAMFTAKSGQPAMLMAMGNADVWDREALDAFIASIK